MRQINVTYHHEAGTWWSESPSVPGFTAAAESLEQLREETRAGLAFALDDAPFMLLETAPGSPWASGNEGRSEAQRSDEPKLSVTVGYRANARPFGSVRNGRLVMA